MLGHRQTRTLNNKKPSEFPQILPPPPASTSTCRTPGRTRPTAKLFCSPPAVFLNVVRRHHYTQRQLTNHVRRMFLIYSVAFMLSGCVAEVAGERSGCAPHEFECACYTPRCIPRSQVRNGVANCADASDEMDAVEPRRVVTRESEMACADLTLSRRRRSDAQPPLLHMNVSPCSKEAEQTCHSYLNQVCVSIRDTAYCLCRRGFFRFQNASGATPQADDDTSAFDDATTCYPVGKYSLVALLRRLATRPPQASSIAAAASSDANLNCSGLLRTLGERYPTIFAMDDEAIAHRMSADDSLNEMLNKLRHYNDDGIAANAGGKESGSGVADAQAAENVSATIPESENVDVASAAVVNELSSKPAESGRRFYNGEVELSAAEVGGALDGGGASVTETTLSECDPNQRQSCAGAGQICTRIFDGSNGTRIVGKCVVEVNECARRELNDCDRNARCIDNDVSYECLCREGFIDASDTPAHFPGRKCRKLVNECHSRALNNCDLNAECVDEPLGYTCRCVDGFADGSPDVDAAPGRVCIQMQLDCDVDCNELYARCVQTAKSATCQCRRGYLDTDPERPGRKCVQVRGSNPCNDYSLHDCDSVAECYSEMPGYFQCKCPKGFVDVSPDRSKAPGRKCQKEVNECELGTHECDANADCLDTPERYACRCKPGWIDLSANPLSAPGRNCKRSDQCKSADCAPEAECHETAGGVQCQCQTGFVDVSKQHGRPAGRVCRPVADECAAGTHDCALNSQCIDTAEAFICRCADGYRDDSANPADRPGRVCTKTAVPEAPECDVNDPMSCAKEKHEVCLFKSGTYKCSCANGYNRLPDGRCLAINECASTRTNKCSPDADCIDLADGYTCQCRSGFADVSPNTGVEPGRICRRRVNECAQPDNFGVDCDANAVCVDTEESYECRCRPGFADVSEMFNRLPGRKCVEAVNECLDSKLNDCSENAICEDAKEGFTCACRPGFVDASPNIGRYPGRICNQLDKEKELSNQLSANVDACDPQNPRCGTNEVCTDKRQKGEFVCECVTGAVRYYDGQCRQLAVCASDADCDKNAACTNVLDSYACQCRPGYHDVSPDAETKPGRVCKELVNECASHAHDCSPFAECVDAPEGYACVCMDGFVDTSSQHSLPPGRRCSNANNECQEKALNTCDENADCIDTPEGYSCQCFAGFIDVSSSAHLPPGRVCTVQTTCPKQKTDLMFLIDGSGSIGSYVFKNEVLRFVRDFLELFDVGLENTRVGLIQYSDQIRHEFDLNQYTDKQSLLQALAQTQYLTGLTRTGAAIQHMVVEGFSERRGARPQTADVSRVAIVITDGRSQDNVTEPAKAARNVHVNTFSIGVTDHVLASELEAIAGSPNRWFYVDRFKDLDMRLRSLIQKLACPAPEHAPRPAGVCNPDSQTGCDRTLNEVCQLVNGKPTCQCPKKFQRHPITHICGGDLCNPEVPTSCLYPDTCEATPFGNHRCVCPADYARDQRTGVCISTKQQSAPPQKCRAGMELNPRTNKCIVPGSCDPSEKVPCDARKREKCLLHPSGQYYTCQCAKDESRHPVTEVCLINECKSGDNECAKTAKCVDTDNGYICTCPPEYIDQSPDPVNKPGRVCAAQQNECSNGANHCSPNAICTDTYSGYVCRCKPGYVDFSPNPQKEPGLVCNPQINECANPQLNTCHPTNAICVDTIESYNCICKPGFTDLDELRNPGRQCQKVESNDRCDVGKNDCDRNAKCVQQANNDFTCICPPGFRDQSPDKVNKPGRVCIPLIPECDNPSLNDCDSPERAICTDTDEGYLCRCRQGFLDISPNITAKPGRLCKALENECAKGTHDCAVDGGICEDTPDSYVCRCAVNYLDVSPERATRPGRKCKKLNNECASGQNDCSPAAICTDTEDSYICACPSTHIDMSPDKANRPGRRCQPRINECAKNLHDCSPNADCVDTPESYECRCGADFVDESPEPVARPGRVCRPALVDECRLGRHDCHPSAVCQDLPHGYTCQCEADYLDESPSRVTQPGRVCVPRPTPPPDECRIDVASSCRADRNEVCRILNGVPKCACPINYDRDPLTQTCTVINECLFPQLNDCHPSAECVDVPNGYRCQCRDGFRDVATGKAPRGRQCQPLVNECQFAHLNDCHFHAECVDTPDGYTCRCATGYDDQRPETPGRLCRKLVNECQRTELNSCDTNARCMDEEVGYRCECRPDFLDVSPSPTLPGRACKRVINECLNASLNDCDRAAKCVDTVDSYTCECPADSRDISPNPVGFPGRVCLVFENECATGRHDCDPQARCRDNEQLYTCECPDGFTDRSPNKLHRPGRVCVKLVDECATGRHTCSAQAECRDLEEGYTCECKNGYVDRSPNLLTQPGRVCGTPETCPPNHECSSAAVCEPLGGNEYRCQCIPGYVDQSPAGTPRGRICVRNNACRDPRLNTCSRNAICYDEPTTASGGTVAAVYRCECIRGYVDKSPKGSAHGRVCEPPIIAASQQQNAPSATVTSRRHSCQDASLNDCHASATCRAVGPTDYTCECLRGHADRSPDVRHRPGRVCVPAEPICLDASRNDCHPTAICAESRDNADGFTCRCRDGYIDQSPDAIRRPGRICKEQINECLDRSLNDCDPIAVCEDTPTFYTCRCPLNAQDESPDPVRRPGRRCRAPVNECANPSLNQCSRFADCVDLDEGYRCRCRTGYHDNRPQQPGTVCTYIIDECQSPNLNDCDAHAECIDLPGGYDCKCKRPYRDEGPANRTGRICRFDECSDPKMNTCDPHGAQCIDTDDGYLCKCKEGFYDQSTNPLEPGRVCLEFVEDKPQIAPVQQSERKPTGIPCGLTECKIELNEVCVGGARCACKPGEGRTTNADKCQPVERTPLAVRIVSRGGQPLFYSSDFGNNQNEHYVELANEFQADVGRAIGSTTYAPRYVNTDVSYITHPKTVNSSWPDGLLVNFTVGTAPNKTPVDQCELWDQLMESIQQTNGAIGGGKILTAADVDLLDPCAKPPPKGETCGGAVCNAELGEICVAETVCGCPSGEKRASPKEKCRPVESWQIPIWVIRKNQHNLLFNETFANPLDEINRQYVHDFETGVAQCYPQTALKNAFVAADVNDIVNPNTVNASWDTGILFNSTVHFRKGTVRVPSDAYYTLIRYIIDKNNYQIGQSGLYINPYQPDPFKACYKNNCHPKGICVDLGPNAYRCECGPSYRDLNPNDPGRECLPTKNYNECERKEDNDCSENARCIDLEYLYKCECLNGFSDASPKGAVPGSVCVLDYCSDVNFCPMNSTCVNTERQAECQCKHGFVDIRASERRIQVGLNPDAYCLNIADVDYCLLGLHNCSAIANCQRLKTGYTCSCPPGYVDGNPSLPGRVCGALLCDMCHQHGDCVHNPQTNNVTCACTEGYTGEFCELAPSSVPLILLIFLALLFLLLTLCCLLYLCTKCRCFKRARAFPWSTLDASASSDSGAGDFSGSELYIPRPKLKQADNMADANAQQLAKYLDDNLRIPRARLHDTDSLGSGSSEYTIREEIERRVITDVTKTELRTTTTENAEGGAETVVTHSSQQHQSYGGGGGGGGAATTSHAITSSSAAGGRSAVFEEQERGESVAEFANSRSGADWRQHGATSSSDYASGSALHQQRHGYQYSGEHQDDRSVGGYAMTDDGTGVYDKSVSVQRHRHVDPTNGAERYKTDVQTTKTVSETFHK